MILGSCDILGGKAVQLEQGDPERRVYEREDVDQLFDKWSLVGRVALVDLDAAFAQGHNRELIAKLCQRAEVHVGGGVRDPETASFYLKAGARKLVIGTAANEEFLSQFHPDHLIVSLDMKKGEVVDHGWTVGTGEHFLDRAKRLLPYCSGFLVTQVDKEGLMQGFDLEPLKQLRELTDKQIIAAGGISTKEEIQDLADLNIDAQLGMALYSGQLDLHEAFVSLGDWSKGLLPTVVQGDSGQILMVGFSNEQSLSRSLEQKQACFFSRQRQKLWTKGETSGDFLNLKRVSWDCDRDTLLFQASPQGSTCHFGSWSCFGEQTSNLWDNLFEDILKRTGQEISTSWTQKLLSDPELLKQKICEESEEVVNFTDAANLRWELADVFYHLAVLMHREKVTLEEVQRELISRRKR